MTKKLQFLGLLLLAVMLALPVLSACTQEAPPPTPPSPTSTAPAAKTTTAPTATTTTPAPAKTIKLRWTAATPTKTYATIPSEWFMDEITKRTGGRITFERYYAGAITKAGEELDAVKGRMVDCGATPSWYYAGKLYLWEAFREIPFGVADNTIVNKVMMRMLDELPELKNEYAQFNQKVFWAHSSSDYHIYCKTPIKTLEDFKGKKMGAAGLVGKWVQVLGSTPVPSPVTERYSNLQTGAEDGGILSFSTMYPYKLEEIAKYFLIVGLGCSVAQTFTMNNDAWNELPKADQDIFLELSRQIPEIAGKSSDSEDQKGMDAALAKGGTILKMSDADRAKWAGMLTNLPKQYAADLEKKGIPGNKFYNLYFKIAKELGWKFYRDWWAE